MYIFRPSIESEICDVTLHHYGGLPDVGFAFLILPPNLPLKWSS